MTNINRDKTIGIIFIATVAASFSATSNVQAAQTFPPAHHAADAVFDETGGQSTGSVNGPWYRPQTPAPTVTFTAADAAATPRLVYIEREPGPWYRATN